MLLKQEDKDARESPDDEESLEDDDDDDDVEDDKEEEENQMDVVSKSRNGLHPPRRIQIRTSGKEVSSSSSGNSDVGSISDSILNGHNIGKITMESLLQKKIGAWVRSTGFKCQKFVVRGDYGPQSPLVYHCMKANLENFDEAKWVLDGERYFDKYGKYIKRTLNHKRNCCQSTIKSILKGKKLCCGKC
jgi:hypothetical protein